MNFAEQSTAEAVRLAKKSELEGADGMMLLPPIRYRATDEEPVAYFDPVANST
jgi:4-hydroxy-tetrahydrodipicolinate synthase